MYDEFSRYQEFSGDDLTKAYNSFRYLSSGLKDVWNFLPYTGSDLMSIWFDSCVGKPITTQFEGSPMVIWGNTLGNSCIPWKSMNGGNSFWKMIGKPPNLK